MLIRLILAAIVASGSVAAQAQTGPSSPGGATPLSERPAVPPLPAPADPLSSVAPARAAAAGAQVRLAASREALADFVRNQRLLFDTSAEYRAALTEQREALAEWTKARDEALSGLESDVEYTQALLIRERLGREIEAERGRAGGGRAEEIDGRSALRLDLGKRMSARQSEILSADANVAAARKRLDTAAGQVADLRRNFQAQLQTSEALASVKKSVRDATEQYAFSASLARETARTADVLLEYAYYAQWISTLRPVVISSPVGYYGAGYGGIYGYTTGSSNPPNTQPGYGSGIGYGLVPGQ